MANEKNKINELVSDDEDPTAELEAITFRQEREPHERAQIESDENTCDFTDRGSDDRKTIGKLRYDIEQLRAKWLGLEAEIKAREELTNELNEDIARLQDSLTQKEELISARDGTIDALKTEIRELNENYRSVTLELANRDVLRHQVEREIPPPPETAHTGPGIKAGIERLARTEAYADSLRRKLQDVLEANKEMENERGRLLRNVDDARMRNQRLTSELANANERIATLDAELASIENRHAEEIRQLRFELGEAQDTVAQTEQLNSQLASDLVETRGFKTELERMLCDNEEKSQQRIEALEAELVRIKKITNDYEQKLESRSESINVLLHELARKSERIGTIDEVGDVISDIDARISEQIEEPNNFRDSERKPSDRVTRMLVGKVGEQLLRFPLFKDRLTIGRTDNNDIQLNAVYISRRHAVVQTDGDKTRVIDWGSKNGVYVNSEKVTERFLENGDILTIGNAHFRYEERPKRDN